MTEKRNKKGKVQKMTATQTPPTLARKSGSPAGYLPVRHRHEEEEEEEQAGDGQERDWTPGRHRQGVLCGMLYL